MSLEKGFKWAYQDLNFKGYSLAGQTTSMVFEGPKICFDIAQGLPFHIASKLFCLTHMHADHGSGLSYLISQRSLFSLPEAQILLPESVIGPIEEILKNWQKIEGFDYSYNLIPANKDTEFQFSKNLKIRTFPTTHRIQSFGYIVYEIKKKLKKEYLNLERQKILDLKSQGQVLEENVEEPLVAFTGDTQIEFILENPEVRKAKVLFTECTYLDNKKSTASAREWGHIHLDEIIENLDKFENEQISLIHLSARYSTPEAQRILQEKLPVDKLGQFSIFPRPM